MSRKRRKPDDINPNSWMDTYADTITLLLTFFILLYSFSTTDNEKLKLIAAALKGQITGIPMKLEDVPDIEDEEKEQGIGEKSPYQILLEDIQEIIDKNGLTDTVKIREEDAGVVLQLSESILFDLGKADLKADSTLVLEVISGLIPAIENEIMVQGHTDNIPISSGTYKSNWELSTSRAVNVVKYFIETKGFDPTRFSATGYGEYRPLVDNATEENRAINRRVDILIVQQKEIVKE
ncbi:OmpA/MotB family protein [Clostridium saudiense]|uniref:OmpA/MotB family protein n=1 Tax=Clostridium saudiense TaxID=1414720 RepID=UPI0026709502|nr:OmpA family protein [Clostridium saudiense]